MTGYAASFDWFASEDFMGYVNDIKPCHKFRSLIDELISQGAELAFFEQYGDDVEEITPEMLDNAIQMCENIHARTDRENELRFGAEQ